MPLTLTPADISLRIGLTALTAIALGFDRRVEGHPAGVRTTLLVALAACLSMIQANWLMNSVGKAPDSFVVLDLMRLPLGILTGVGFIGGGAILKRGDSVSGLTTAATLWFVTVVGLCLGGGQLGLGIAGSVLGYGVLRGLNALEDRLKQEHTAELNIRWRQDAFDVEAALAVVRSAGATVARVGLKRDVAERVDELNCLVRLTSLPGEHGVPAAIAGLAERDGVVEWGWKD